MRCPQLIRVPLGKNNLPQFSTVDLIIAVMEDFCYIEQLFQGVVIAWVDLLPRHVWHGAVKPKAVDVSRQKVNRDIPKDMQWSGWSVLSLPRIFFGLPQLFRSDGVYLYLEVYNTNLANLALGIKCAISQWGGWGKAH